MTPPPTPPPTVAPLIVADVGRLEELIEKATPQGLTLEPNTVFPHNRLHYRPKDPNAKVDWKVEAELMLTLRNLAPQLIAAARRELARPVAGVTADGVEVWDGDVLYNRDGVGRCSARWPIPREDIARCWYSSPEAAARAAGGK